jgi:hypothetical protein
MSTADVAFSIGATQAEGWVEVRVFSDTPVDMRVAALQIERMP